MGWSLQYGVGSSVWGGVFSMGWGVQFYEVYEVGRYAVCLIYNESMNVIFHYILFQSLQHGHGEHIWFMSVTDKSQVCVYM